MKYYTHFMHRVYRLHDIVQDDWTEHRFRAWHVTHFLDKPVSCTLSDRRYICLPEDDAKKLLNMWASNCALKRSRVEYKLGKPLDNPVNTS